MFEFPHEFQGRGSGESIVSSTLYYTTNNAYQLNPAASIAVSTSASMVGFIHRVRSSSGRPNSYVSNNEDRNCKKRRRAMEILLSYSNQ